MDEMQMIRTLRPDLSYPEDEWRAARALLLAESVQARRAPAPRHRARRGLVSWRAGIAAAVAVSAAASFAAVQLLGAHHIAVRNGASATSGGSVSQVLQLAAKTARADATSAPAGARWEVQELINASKASNGKLQCFLRGFVSVSAAGQTMYDPTKTGALHGVPCRAEPPVSIPELNGAKAVPVPAIPSWGNLPDQPGPLLKAIYRQLSAGKVSEANLNEQVFDALVLMLNSGITAPSQSVIFEAIAKVPGTTEVTGVRNVLGRAGIEITVAGGEDRESFILDPSTYQLIGTSMVLTSPGLGKVAIGSATVWQAYYDSQGNKL
jgi:hypothetical protein